MSHVRSPKSYLASAAVQQYRAVKPGATPSDVVPATAASVNRGIAIDNQDTIGKSVAVAEDPSDTPLWESGAAFLAAALLTSDGTGRAVTAVATNPVTARSIDAATAAGQLVKVRPAMPGEVAP